MGDEERATFVPAEPVSRRSVRLPDISLAVFGHPRLPGGGLHG
jgi:hypothetical protein